MIQDALQRLADRLDVPGFPWKNLVFGFSVGSFCLRSFLLYRQYKVWQRTTIPKPLQKEVSQKTFDDSQEYSRAKAKFGLVSSVISEVKSAAVLYYNALPLAWAVSGSIVRSFGSPRFSGEITQSVVFFLLQSVVDLVTDVPLDYYQNFVLEQHFGFNKLTTSLWVKDNFKNFAVSAAITSPLVAAVLLLVQKTGNSFFYYLWSFIVVVQMVLMTVYPILITPLFNKLEPLAKESLKQSLEALCKRTDVQFPLDKLLVIDGSTRSAHSNAYFTGLPWKKQIVLYDTLVDSSEDSEVEGVLAHEIGHWKKNHLLSMVAFMQFYLFTIFSLWSSFVKNESLFTSFGFAKGETPIMIGLLLFLNIYTPVSTVVSLVRNLASQAMEYDADQYAVSLGYRNELARALVRLQIENLSSMDADWLYSAFNFSHPILPERLRAIEWVNEGKPVVSHEQQKENRQKKQKSETEPAAVPKPDRDGVGQATGADRDVLVDQTVRRNVQVQPEVDVADKKRAVVN